MENLLRFKTYSVKICPDQLFVKHAAILGNTGSGKSCTFTSIIRNLFKYDYNDKKLENAHFIIFDTNGEYKDAFLPDPQNVDCENDEQLKQINAYYYGGDEKVKVPYWLMNWDDFKFLLKPGEGTQAPILNRAIGLAKNEQESINQSVLPNNLKADIESILDISTEDLKKRTGKQSYANWDWKEDNEIKGIGFAIKKINEELGNKIIELSKKENFNNANKQQPIRADIEKIYLKCNADNLGKQITSEQNIDLPIWFSYQELCTKFIDAAISQESTNSNKINEFVSTLRLRINSFLNDKRMAVPLMLKDTEEANREILPQFISLLLGDFNKVFANGDPK